MSKYGWSKGTGLGADGSGIVNPLRVQVEKRRKKPDSEGGGFTDPKGIGKIIGGKKNSAGKDSEHGKFGVMSEVIVLRGMVDGMDLDEEVGDGGLMQEIGDECSEKVGIPDIIFLIRGLPFRSMVVWNEYILTDVAMLPQKCLSNSQASYQPSEPSTHSKAESSMGIPSQQCFMNLKSLKRGSTNDFSKVSLFCSMQESSIICIIIRH